jgi:hypothetical protein
MNKGLLGLLLVAFLGYWGWHFFAPAPQPAPATRAPAQRPSSGPAVVARRVPAKPSSTQQSVARATPGRSIVAKQPRLAPEGTYFLLQRASLKIDSGVIGFAPGTKVTLVDRNDSMSTVSDGQYQFTVASSQLTNDLDVANSVAQADYAAQTKIAESIAKSVREYEQEQRDEFINSEKEKGQRKTGRRTASPTPRR